MAVLDPPSIDGGQALHDGYLNYLIGLADISGSGAIAIDEAPDAQAIADIVDQIEFETDQLGQADYGLAGICTKPRPTCPGWWTRNSSSPAMVARSPRCADP